jgi:DNA polymerase
VLDRALGEAGLVRDEVYVTNVVKHFKFSQRGKRRLHETPRDPEILACRPWLEAELHSVQPAVLVCLGATAARAILGPWFRITRQRGEFFKTAFCPRTLATFHPSAVLRAQEPEDQERIYALLRDDLRAVAGAIRS